MKRFFIAFIFIISFLCLHSQNIVVLENVDSVFSENSSYFEGAYSIFTEDTIYIGSAYAITGFDMMTHELSLYVLADSSMSLFYVWRFQISPNNVNDCVDGSLYISDNIVTYIVSIYNEHFNVTLSRKHNGFILIYTGMFKLEEDLD